MVTEIYNNVFHSFWTFAGTAILLGILTDGVRSLMATVAVMIRR